MSLSYQPLNPVLVRDPITQVDAQRDYAILKGGNAVTWKKYTTTSISNSSINWSCPPPSGNVFVDRKQYSLIPVRLTFTASGGTGTIIRAGSDAPRAFPLSGSTETLQSSINGQACSIFISDIVHALTHYNTDLALHNGDYSMTPTYYDQSQIYSSLAPGTVRNPLGSYSNGTDHCPMQRGAFPFTIVSDNGTTAVVDMVICEPLFLSPYYWGCGNASGFYNVTTMDFTLTFLTNANRYWSHSPIAGAPVISNISSQFNNFSPAFSYEESQPLMLFKYIQPDETQILSPNMPITYPYFDVQRYPTDQNTITAGSTSLMNSNNLQLNSIPRMIYVWARTRNQDLYTAGTGCTLTDTYLSLENINVTFANYTGLLSSASKWQLYQIAKKNGCGMNWTQWSGGYTNDASGFPGVPYGTCGSVLAIELACDLGLPSDMAPGLQGQFQLQINATFKNTSSISITPTLYITIVSEGSFTIPGLNSSTKQLGIISKADILDSKSNPSVNYEDIRESQYGGSGNFLSNLQKFGSKVNEFLKGTKLASTILKEIPHPYAQKALPFVQKLGYGNDGGVVIDHSQYVDCEGGVGVGGVPVGGVRMSKAELKNRLKRMR